MAKSILYSVTKKCDTKFEAVSCLICGSKRSETIFKTSDRFDIEAGEIFTITRCSACDFIYLNPRPTVAAIGSFYRSAGYQPFLSSQQKTSLLDKGYRLLRKSTVVAKRRKIERLKTGGRLLDIGCGTGEFLHEMQSNSWEVSGIEKDPQAATFARETFDMQISTDDLAENKYLEKSYDVVTLWHVLEHLYEPTETLAIISGILKDDGLILVAVPNVASFDAEFYSENWVALDAPRHLYHFTPGSMEALTDKADLRILKARQMPLDAFYNCLMSELILRDKNISKRGLLPIYLVRAFFTALLTIVVAAGSGAAGRKQGSSVLYFIKKK